MPRPIDWFQRLPKILELLKEPVQPPLLNRQSIQDLFGVERRNAQYLLKRFGASRLGNALVIERSQLAAALEGLSGEDDMARQVRRHQQVRTVLANRRATLQLSRITLPEPAGRMAELPPSIHLRPGHLSIEFSGAVDLLSQLLELSQAMGKDFDHFEGMLTQDPLIE